jgi:hypothetical protein
LRWIGVGLEVSLWLEDQQIDAAMSCGMSVFDAGAPTAFHLRQLRRDRILGGQAETRSLEIRFGRPRLGQAQVDKAKRGTECWQGCAVVARIGQNFGGIGQQAKGFDGVAAANG